MRIRFGCELDSRIYDNIREGRRTGVMSRRHKCSVTVTYRCRTSVFGYILFCSVSVTGPVLETVMRWEYSNVFLIYVLEMCLVCKDDNVLSKKQNHIKLTRTGVHIFSRNIGATSKL